MRIKSGAGVVEHPAVDDITTSNTNAPNVYINNDDDFEDLRKHPLIQEFANVESDIYNLVAISNPTLKLFFDVARKICGVTE